MNIILTGASSFIGSAVAKQLHQKGHELKLFRHSFEEAPERLPREADCWLHFAWAGAGSKGRMDEDIQNFNIEMSMAALRKAADLGCRRFLFAGSQAEYGSAKPGRLQKETDVCVPRSAYGKAKLAFGKRACRWVESCIEEDDEVKPMQFVHMRIFSVYGSGDHEGSLISTALDAFTKDEPMQLSPCTQDWNYLHIEDAADAVCLLTEAPTETLSKALREENASEGNAPSHTLACEARQPEGLSNTGWQAGYGFTVNVAGGDTRPLRSYIEEMHRICGSKSELRFGTRNSNAEGASDLRPDTGRLRALGFQEKVRFSEGISKLLSEKEDTASRNKG